MYMDKHHEWLREAAAQGDTAKVLTLLQQGCDVDAQDEVDVGRQAGIPAHVSHMQPGAPRLGCAHELLALIDDERRSGLDASCDAIPYTIGSTTLKSLLPPWACDGGDAAMIQRLKDPATRTRIIDDTNTHGAESGGSRKRKR